MKIQIAIAISTLAVIGGCSSYSDRGVADTGGREVSDKGYTVSCDATPKNQPGCYQRTGSSWGWGGLKFSVGN